MNFETWFQSKHPKISSKGLEAVINLSSEGATVPFMARYRKERTGNLDEVQIQAVIDGKEEWDKLIQRKEHVLGEIERQKKLTPELKEKILQTYDSVVLEDLYLPYKQKKKSKATLAKEAGLEPFADWIWNCGHGTEQPLEGQTLELWGYTFRNEEKGIKEVSDVIAGAQDILIERLSENSNLRSLVRETLFRDGELQTGKGDKVKPNSKYEKYFAARESIASLRAPQNTHRYLAMRRGWLEGELTLTMGGAPADTQFESRLVDAFEREACTVPESPGAELLKKCARIAYKAHVIPSIENEVHKVLKEAADAVAISVFSENVRKLLLSSPFGSKAVLGVDPGVRTGCKVALVDDSGKFLNHGVLKLQNDEGKQAAKAWLTEVLNQSTIQAIAVGNGTAGRETELFLRAFLKELGKEVPIVLVNEAGASVYSASEVAREEFPDLDVTIRGAISIARRLQDPLAELVKIDPKSIGVGQYQHDIAPHALKKSLAQVVDSCVHSVGINLNTASYHLLSHVSGIGEALAKAIVTRRGEKGLFRARTDLMEIPHFSAKTFELAAGFLRIPGAENILDNTGVHPEKYPILEAWASKKAKQIAEWVGSGVQELKNDKEFAAEIGEFTFQDILEELAKPGRDPRETFVPFQFREDIHELKDLQVGMECPGIVTNVTNFGAFVDIGVHQDGLVHLSQLADRFVKDPKEVVSPGDRVKVRVIEVNLEKKQIALSMKRERAERVERKPAGDRRPRPDFKRPERPQGGPQSQVAREARRPMPMKPKGPPKPKFTHNPFADLMSLKFEKDKK